MQWEQRENAVEAVPKHAVGAAGPKFQSQPD